MKWTVKELMGEIAAVLVRLERDDAFAARTMLEMIVDDKAYARAVKEYEKEFGGEDDTD